MQQAWNIRDTNLVSHGALLELRLRLGTIKKATYTFDTPLIFSACVWIFKFRLDRIELLLLLTEFYIHPVVTSIVGQREFKFA